MARKRLWFWSKIAVAAVVYVLAARLGLRFATVGRSITLIWPPAGLALAALLLMGPRLWPAIALGALFVNATTPGVPFAAACGIAFGNTLEALTGTYLLRRFGFNQSLERLQDVLLLVIFAAGFSTLIGATVGTASLRLGEVIDSAHFGAAWRHWWLGDLMGDLIVAPLLLTWATRSGPPWRSHRRLEAALLSVTLVAVSLLASGAFPLPKGFLFQHPYAVFPILIWAALRFLLLGAASANFVIATVTAWATLRFGGPFVGSNLGESLFMLQSFMAVVAVTGLILGAAARERSHALRLRDEFMSMASHELRTPLTPLKLQLHLLKRLTEENSARGASHELNLKFDQVDRQVDRLVKLVDELLDVSRVSAGRLSLEPEQLELGALVRETVEGFREQLAQRGSQVDVQVDEPVFGKWDRLRLQQVVSNLLTNAMKYGNGKPIQVSVKSSAQSAFLIVKDHGVGIAKEHQQIIFEPFERGRYGPGTGGLGLGLYIVSKIIDAHRGAVRVTSEPGSGATFRVELPLGRTQ